MPSGISCKHGRVSRPVRRRSRRSRVMLACAASGLPNQVGHRGQDGGRPASSPAVAQRPANTAYGRLQSPEGSESEHFNQVRALIKGTPPGLESRTRGLRVRSRARIDGSRSFSLQWGACCDIAATAVGAGDGDSKTSASGVGTTAEPPLASGMESETAPGVWAHSSHCPIRRTLR
jgi:hypothetical protein